MAAKRKQGLQNKDLRDAIVKCELDDENGLISRNGDKDLDEDMWPYGPSLCKKPSTPSRDLSSPVRAEETGSAHDETSSSGHKDDDDDDEEDSDDLKAIPHDTERLKAFNMFVRLFVDENLDRQVPISKQPKEKIQAIIDSCTRQFPEFGDRARKRIRTYLKSCRRNKKTRDSSSWPESNRPTPAHLTSVQAEQILAQACENESHNAKRMRLGLEPVSQPMPILPNNCEPARTLMDHFSPANLTSVADIKLNNNNNKPESPNCHLKTSLHHDLTKTVNSTASTMSSSPANGGFRGNSSPAFPGSHGFTSTPIFSGYPQPTVHNGPTDLSMKSVKPILSHKLNPTEIAAVRQLITGYRESAAFLLRSADELEQLLIQQQ